MSIIIPLIILEHLMYCMARLDMSNFTRLTEIRVEEVKARAHGLKDVKSMRVTPTDTQLLGQDFAAEVQQERKTLATLRGAFQPRNNSGVITINILKHDHIIINILLGRGRSPHRGSYKRGFGRARGRGHPNKRGGNQGSSDCSSGYRRSHEGDQDDQPHPKKSAHRGARGGKPKSRGNK